MKNMNCSEISNEYAGAQQQKVIVDLQIALDESKQLESQVPSLQQIESWVVAVLADLSRVEETEVSIRVVDAAEMAELNKTYRHKAGTTNVLSFPFSSPKGVDVSLLGDIVICLPVIVQESADQAKNNIDHWAHMIVHGMLHLLGYDHVSDEQAEQMEKLEIEILARLKISNPYGETERK